MFEALEQPHPASADEPGVQAVAEAVDVEEREREQESIGPGNLPAGGKIQCISGEIIVGEHRAFRCSRGSGGIDDPGGRLAVDGSDRTFVRQPCGCSRDVVRIPDGKGTREFGARYDCGGVGIGEDVGNLSVAVEDIDGNENDPELDAGEEKIDHLDAIGQVYAKAVAGMEAALGEQLSQAIAATVDVAEGVGGALIFKCGGVAAAE